MRVSWSISKRRDRIRALLSLPRLAYKRAEKFQESSLLYMFAMNVELWNWPCMQQIVYTLIHPAAHD
jgi:hypothetical protein